MPDDKVRRALTVGELREASWVYGTQIDFATALINRGRYAFWQPDNVAMAPNGQVYFPPPIYRADFSITASAMALLIHELAHVWQIQSGIWLKFRRLLIEGGVYDYGALPADANLRRHTVEQQASIIADWYLIRHRLEPQHGSGAVGDYEAVIRRAIPARRS